MNYMNILYAVLILGLLGVFFGAVLAVASKVFAVEKDSRADEILENLPGANCGGCGYSGCSAYANALVNENARVGACPVGGEKLAEKIAEILGVKPGKNTRITAMVLCSGGNHAKKKYEYAGAHDCVSANALAGGPLSCEYGCLGFGTCMSACLFDAIHIKDGVAKVDHEKCTGCLRCLNACPRHIIVSVPYTADVNVLCSSHLRGPDLRKICEIGCIGCKLCEKTCKYDAIHVVDNLAVIDHEKCTSCGECAKKCPRHLIVDANLLNEEEDAELIRARANEQA